MRKFDFFEKVLVEKFIQFGPYLTLTIICEEFKKKKNPRSQIVLHISGFKIRKIFKGLDKHWHWVPKNLVKMEVSLVLEIIKCKDW